MKNALLNKTCILHEFSQQKCMHFPKFSLVEILVEN